MSSATDFPLVKREYDFFKGGRAKLYRRGATLRIPVYLADAQLEDGFEAVRAALRRRIVLEEGPGQATERCNSGSRHPNLGSSHSNPRS